MISGPLVTFFDNELKIELSFGGKNGAIYFRHYVHSPSERNMRKTLPSSCSFKIWLNGNVVHEVKTEGMSRPNYAGDGRNCADAKLKEG